MIGYDQFWGLPILMRNCWPSLARLFLIHLALGNSTATEKDFLAKGILADILIIPHTNTVVEYFYLFSLAAQY